MGFMNNWFLVALVGMFSFAGMALTLKKLTYTLATPLILLYLFLFTSVLYLAYNLKIGEALKIGFTPLLLLLLASCLAFLGNLCDVEALEPPPKK